MRRERIEKTYGYDKFPGYFRRQVYFVDRSSLTIQHVSMCRRRLKCPVQSLETFAQRTQPREAGNIPRDSLQGPAESSYAAGLVRSFSAFSLNLKSTLRMAEMMKPDAIEPRPITNDNWDDPLHNGKKW